MVISSLFQYGLIAQQTQETVLEKLDPDRRAAVILSLIALGFLGGLLVVIVMLAGRWARQSRPKRASRQTGETQQKSPGSVRLPGNEQRSNETMVSNQGDNETKA